MYKISPLARLFSLIVTIFMLTFTVGSIRFSWTLSSQLQDKPTFEKWAEDVDFLIQELPRLHTNLFFKLKKDKFLEKAARFKKSLPSFNYDEFYVGLSRLVASVGDSHTTLRLQIKHAFPLMLYWFKEGIYVINTIPEYEKILYGRVTAFNNRPIEEVIEAFSEIIPHENEAQIKSSIPQIMASAEHLHGLNIIPDIDKTMFTVENERGQCVSVELKSMPIRGPLKGIVDTKDATAWPLYMKNRSQFYWFEYLPSVKAIYFKYNSCRNMPHKPFSEFSKELLDAIQNNPVDKFVIDLRNNGGGNSGILDPFIETLAKNDKMKQKGHLFVIIGRQTFSSAILNAVDLKQKTEAILIGEPTGGKPNHFGEIRFLTLPNTKLVITYSTKYFQHADDDTPSLMPDIPIEISIKDYKDRRDSVLNAILAEDN